MQRGPQDALHGRLHSECRKTYTPPGLELLEAAARAAGFEFQRCIEIPVAPPPLEGTAAWALEVFTEALNDDYRRGEAVESAIALDRVEKNRRAGSGGKKRKKR